MSSFQDRLKKALEEIANKGGDLRVSVDFEQGFNYNSFNDEHNPTIISGNIIEPKSMNLLGHYRYIDGEIGSFTLYDKDDNLVVDGTIDFWATNEIEAKEEIVETVQNYAAQYLL